MEFFYAIILGVVQGLTEFLPVSSSAHLAIIGKYLDINQPGILFEVLLHAGTTLAVVWYFREKILALKTNDLILLALGTIPAALVGILFEEELTNLFSFIKLIGVQLLITAFLNFRIDKHSGKREYLDKFDAVLMGIFQAIAIIPGISRSGATIYAGTRMNISKQKAAEFSFLLSIPAIIGANLVEIVKHGGDGDFSLGLGLVGLVVAFATGLLSINFLMEMLSQRRLKFFSYYLIVIGLITIFFL